MTQVQSSKQFNQVPLWLATSLARSLATLFTTALLSAGMIVSAKAEQLYDAFDQTVKVTTSSKASFLEFAGSYKVLADVGKLPANRHGVIRVRIQNSEDFDLPISHATAPCDCTQAELMDTRIPAKGQTELLIKVKTPDQSRNAKFAGQITLHIDKARTKHKKLMGINLMLQYRIENMLCFSRKLVPVSVTGPEPANLKIPFVCTVKTPLDQLKIETTEALHGIEGKIENIGDGKAQVTLSIDPSDASEHGESGKITISDPQTKASATVSVIIYRQQRITVSPRTLRFSSTDENSDKLTAYAIIRVRPTEKEQANKEQKKLAVNTKTANKSRAIHGEASINGVKLNTKFSPLTGQISRAEFSLTQQQWQSMQNEKKTDYEINWTVLTADARASGKAPAVILDP